jgi:hypothetical protein
VKFTLPKPGDRYDPSTMKQIVSQVEAALAKCLTSGSTITVSTGTVLRFVSPSGIAYTLTVDDAGRVITTT